MEVISSFLDNLKQKLTNPLFGTLIFVWCIRNFNFLFSLFNFDAGMLLSEKVSYISKYYEGKCLAWEFIVNISFALVLLLVGYGFVIISRIIMNLVYHRMIPWLNKRLVDEKAFTVDKTRFDIVKKQRDESYEKVLELNEIIVGLEQSNSEFKTKNIELQSSNSTNVIALENINRDLNIARNTIQTQNNKIIKLENELKSYINDKKNKQNDDLFTKYFPIFETLVSKKLDTYFIEYCNYILTGSFNGNELVLDYYKLNEIENLGLIYKYKKDYNDNTTVYKLSNTGFFIYNNIDSYQTF